MVIGLGAMALGGAALGSISGAISGAIGQAGQTKQRRRVREGMNMGMLQAGREIGSYMNSPEIQAMRQFLHGLYGISPDAGRGGGLGMAQTLQGNAVVDPDAPTQGMRFKALGKQGKQAVMGAYKQLSEYSRAQRLANSGVELSPSEQARVDELLGSDRAGSLVKSLEGMSGVEQNWVARLLQERQGIGAEDFNSLYGGLRSAAGLEPVAAQQTGVDLSAGLNTAINPAIGNFQKSLQQAQASRGLFSSNAAAAAEASGMSAFLFNQQQALLPALQNLATLDVGALAQSIQGNRINQQVGMMTGGGMAGGGQIGLEALQGGLSGLFGGASLGVNMGGLFGNAAQQAPTQGALGAQNADITQLYLKQLGLGA